jgi:hypothetical protein
MSYREAFDAWWDSVPWEDKVLAAHPVNAAEVFAWKGWQEAMRAAAAICERSQAGDSRKQARMDTARACAVAILGETK